MHNQNFLWRFTGEDPYILSNCGKKTKRKFNIIGLCVLIILLATFISFTYGVYELLESYYFGLALGIYFAFVILLLYLFTLYTLTKNVLPVANPSKRGRIASYIIRVGFLMFLGIIVSQPIEYALFSNQVDVLLNDEITSEIVTRNNKLNSEYAYKLKECYSLNLSDNVIAQEVLKFKAEKKERLEYFVNFQYSKNFFIRKMILMDTSEKTSYIWFFSALFVLIFIIPVIIKSRIPLDSSYYKNKKRVQQELISDHFNHTLTEYNKILSTRFRKFDLSKQLKYTDPPYNTIRIQELIYQSDSEFSKWLVSENN